ncbi:hypothetical protein GXW82_39480 [Streptacidiphilus sp. 4-A2]|nr:hypothetical protein [Streptacidiphilus sp. 4-A2]
MGGGVGAGGFGGGFTEGPDDFAASSARSGTGGFTSADEVGQPGSEAPGASAEEVTGMGGFPGGLNGQDKKRKRRPRAHYLVEDPETWETDVAVNPPVIM